LGESWLWEPILRYPKPSLGSQSYTQELVQALCYVTATPGLSCGDLSAGSSLDGNLTVQELLLHAQLPAQRRVCLHWTLPGLCLAAWLGFPCPLAREENGPDTESGLAESHCHGWMPSLLGCISVLETRCSNQLHHWTHEIMSRARPANVTELKRGVSGGDTVFKQLWRDSGERSSLNSRLSVVQISFPLL